MKLKDLLKVMEPEQLLTVEILYKTLPEVVSVKDCTGRITDCKVINIYSATTGYGKLLADSAIRIELEEVAE